MAETPAKWNVLSVICVAGSRMLCAAMVPIISPGWAMECVNRCRTSPISQSNASVVSRCFSVHRLLLSTLRKLACRSSVAFFCASTLSASEPGTTMMFRHSSSTFSTTRRGSRPVGFRTSMPNLVLAFQISRFRFTGR